MDDNIIKHYSNEDTFQISMEEIGGMYKLTLTEIWLKEPHSDGKLTEVYTSGSTAILDWIWNLNNVVFVLFGVKQERKSKKIGKSKLDLFFFFFKKTNSAKFDM